MGIFYDAAFETGKNGQYFDLEQAKTLMKQSKHANGAEVSLLSNNSGTAPRQAEVIQAQLAKIGVRVNIELADSPTFRRRWLQEKQWDLVQIQRPDYGGGGSSKFTVVINRVWTVTVLPARGTKTTVSPSTSG